MTERIEKRVKFILENDLCPKGKKVEYSPIGESISEAMEIALKLREYILAQPVITDLGCLLTGQLRFDGSVPSDLFPRTGHKNFGDLCRDYYNKPQENLCTFEWQHSTPDYSYVLKHGISGLKERIAASKKVHAGNPEKVDYLNALDYTADTMILWAHKCADECRKQAENENEPRKAELLLMAENLRQVPEFEAKTFYQGIQTIAICFNMLSDSIGTIDRYLIDLYRNDIQECTLTKEQATEYLQDLFVRLDAQTLHSSINKNRGGECHFAIGGYLPDGSDGFNELSHTIVEALMDIPLNTPQISLRYTKKTPREVLRFMLDCERRDIHKRIAFVNDDPRIDAFMRNAGISYEDAVSYTMVGCNEPAFPGSMWMGGCTSNVARSIANTLYERSEDVLKCETFEEFFAIYEEELTKDIERIRYYTNYFNHRRAKDINVLSALLLEGCIENAKSPTHSGCRIKIGGAGMMGLVCAIDSLSIIKQFVYDEKIVSMNTMLDALKANWEGYEELRTQIMKKGKFFGNNYSLSDEVAQRFTTKLHSLCTKEKLDFDVSMLLGNLTGYNPHYAFFGAQTPATPDGRYAGDAFMVGIGQSGNRDREGLTALLSSVADFDPKGIFCGPTVCNVLLDEAMVKNDDNFEKLVTIIDTYFSMGGLHIQLNYVTKEELLEAKKTPEKYNQLKVRVSGFSGYFTTLREELQDDVIKRTEIKH